MAPNPPRHDILADFSRRHGKNDCRDCFLWRFKIKPVQIQKDNHGRQRGSLIAVDKRMIPSNAETIGRRKGRKISFAIRELIDRPGQRRFQKTPIAYSVGAAE